MAHFKIKWCFTNSKTATKAIDLLGAHSLDKINFYVDNKKIDYSRYFHLANFEADEKAKKEIRKFFKQNQGMNDFVEFVKN